MDSGYLQKEKEQKWTQIRQKKKREWIVPSGRFHAPFAFKFLEISINHWEVKFAVSRLNYKQVLQLQTDLKQDVRR